MPPTDQEDHEPQRAIPPLRTPSQTRLHMVRSTVSPPPARLWLVVPAGERGASGIDVDRVGAPGRTVEEVHGGAPFGFRLCDDHLPSGTRPRARKR